MARILIVDDEPVVRAALRVYLEADGHDVWEASNGAAVDDLLAEHAPDVVIVDILMPVKDGIETIIGLRRSGHPAKIIAMSGGSGRNLNFLNIARRLGADATLEKPFDGDDLQAVIGKVLSS